jgi:hypothetical protein
LIDWHHSGNSLLQIVIWWMKNQSFLDASYYLAVFAVDRTELQ